MPSKSIRQTWLVILSLPTLLGLGAAASATAADDHHQLPFPNWPPLLYRSTTLDGALMGRHALGPLFEVSHTESGAELQALPRPLFTSRTSAAERNCHILWPAAVLHFADDTFRHRILLALLERNDQAWKTWLLPLLFAGNSTEHGPYAAVFPLGGTIHDIIGYDRIRFGLFPLYLSTDNKNTRSWSVLWPLFSVTRGPELSKWRVFPLYGRSTTPTAQQQFALWPILNWAEQSLPTGQTGRGFLLLPLGGHYRVTDTATGATIAESHSLLWPFFSRAVANDAYRLHCPWPFIQIERRPNYQERSFWPFYGTSTRPTSRHTFIAWPIYQHWHRQAQPGQNQSMRWFLPFYWSRTQQENDLTVRAQRKLWPLFASERHLDHTAWRAPALWPQINSEPIDRNYTPLWTILHYQGSPQHQQFSAFWHWFHYRRTPTSRQWEWFPFVRYQRQRELRQYSIGRGLLGWRRSPDQRALRLLWLTIPIGRQPTPAAPL